MISRNLIRALNQPWLIEPEAAQKWALIALDLLQPGAIVNPVSARANAESVPYVKNGVMILPVNGPIMKYEDCGSPGTSNMIASLQQAMADPGIEGVVLQIDSPGGSVDGTKVFADAIAASTKPVVAFVDGMMCSAAQWIGSSAKGGTIASTNHDIVGSIGTMVQWADFSEAYKQKGIKVHTAYATNSTDKNKMFSDANAGNYTELITSMLDPINNEFMGAVQSNRAGKIDLSKENVLTGKTYMAKDAIKYGLVDKIGSLDMAIKTVKKLASAKQTTMNTTATAFKKTLVAAKAPSFEVVDNIGFGLSEENLNNIEAHITEQATTIETANQTAVTLQEQVDELTGSLATANNSLNTITAERDGLIAKVAKLSGKPAPVVKDPSATEDAAPASTATLMTSYDLEKQARAKKFGLTKQSTATK